MITARLARQASDDSLQVLGGHWIRDLTGELEHRIHGAYQEGGYAASVGLPPFAGKEMYLFVTSALRRLFKKQGFKPYLATWDHSKLQFTDFGVKW